MPLTFEQAMAFGRGIPQMEARYSGSIANTVRNIEDKRRNKALELAEQLRRQDELEQRAYERRELHRKETDVLLGELEAAADAKDWDSVERIGGAIGRLGYGFSKEGPQARQPTAQPGTMGQAVTAGASMFDRVVDAGKGALSGIGDFLYPGKFGKPADPQVDPSTIVGSTFDRVAKGPFETAVEKGKKVLGELATEPGSSASVRIPVDEKATPQGVPDETRVDPRELQEYVVRSPDGTVIARVSGAKMREQNRINFDRVSSEMVNGIDDPDLQKDVRLASKLVRSQNLPIAEAQKELSAWIKHLSSLSASERRADLVAAVQRARISIGQTVTGEDRADDYIKGGRYGLAQIKAIKADGTFESYAAIREMMENAAANNGLANSAASYKGARAMQGTGPITDADIKNLSVKDQTIGAALAHKVNYLLPGLVDEGLTDEEIQSRLNFTDDERRVMTQFGRIRMRQIQQRAIEQEAGLYETWSRMPPSQQRDGFRDAVVGQLQQIPGLYNPERWGAAGAPKTEAAPRGEKKPTKKFEEMDPAEQAADLEEFK